MNLLLLDLILKLDLLGHLLLSLDFDGLFLLSFFFPLFLSGILLLLWLLLNNLLYRRCRVYNDVL